jgi:hypothetical protein
MSQNFTQFLKLRGEEKKVQKIDFSVMSKSEQHNRWSSSSLSFFFRNSFSVLLPRAFQMCSADK